MQSASDASPLQVTDRQVGPAIVLSIAGHLDAASAPSFRRRMQSFMELGARWFVIDGRDLLYISSAGLGVFSASKPELDQKGGKIVLFGLRPNVFDTFHMLGLTDMFRFVEQESEAIALVGEARED